jgi:hypothetical protein
MEAWLQIPLPLRYDGAERRRPFGEYPDAERRVIGPPTEQDHPELHEPPPDDLQPPAS